MALESPKIKSEKPSLKILRGGKFDETSFIRRVEKILPRVQNTNNVNFLLSVFNQYHTLPLDESLKEDEREKAEEISALAAERLAVLGHSVNDEAGTSVDLEDKFENY